ncbi:MAG: GNAT family N-acetyltransferase [Mariprofundaceae bacterium]
MKYSFFPGVSLRPVADTDLPFLFEIYASTRSDIAMLDWPDEEKKQLLQLQFYAQNSYYINQFKTASFDLICKDKLAIGRFYVHRREQEIRVIDIALLPQYQGQGIGSGLLRALIDEADELDLPVSIHVQQNNPALHLYRRLGFEYVRLEGIHELMTRPPTREALNKPWINS